MLPVQTIGVAETVKADRARPDAASPASTRGATCSRMNTSLWNGCTSRPSATVAAFSVMRGPRPATQTGGGPWGFGPGSNIGVMSVCR